MRGRLALVVAVAVLGGVTLSACQRDPSVAARANGQVLTESQVETQYADALAGTPVPPPGSTEPSAITRQNVVVTFLLGNSCRKLQAAEGFQVPPVEPEDYAAYAQQAGVVADSQYARDTRDMIACVNAALGSSPSVQPTTEELQDVFKRGQDIGLYPADAPFVDFRDEILASPGIASGIAVKHRFQRMLADAGAEVNPRYWPLNFTMANFPNVNYPAVTALIGGDVSDAVKH